MMRFTLLLTGFLLLFSFRSISQEKVYVSYFQNEGCSRQVGISSTILFTDFVNEKGHFSAEIAHKRDTIGDVESLNEAREGAELISAKYVVTGKIVKLEGTYYINVSLHASSSGNLFWSSYRQTNNGNDLPILIKELAYALAQPTDNSSKGKIYQVSSSDAKKLNKVASNRSFGVITGAMMPLSEKENSHINPGFGGLLSFDSRSFIFETSAEVYFGQDSLYDGYSYDEINNRYYNFMINTIYPFNENKCSPFVSLAMGLSYRESEVKYYPPLPGGVEREFKYDQGLMINGGGGYVIKRNSDVKLFIYARGYMIMREFDIPMYGVMFNLAMQFEHF